LQTNYVLRNIAFLPAGSYRISLVSNSGTPKHPGCHNLFIRYIVAGGAGFIGSNLADTLAQHHDVVIIDNLATVPAG